LLRKTEPYSSKTLFKRIKKRGTSWYLLKFKKPKILEDVLYSQMRRCKKALDRLLTENGFRVLRSTFYCNADCFLIYEMEISHVSKVTKHVGPNVYSKHAERFLKHYRENKTFIENDNWVVEIEREFTFALQFLRNLIKKSKKELLKKGIPSKIVPKIKKCNIYGDNNFLKGINNSPKEFKSFFREWFEEDLF